jgi:two-component system OmpR family sensor kinase
MRWLTRLSDRTPLRTKLITGVLVLVILALVAISISTVAVLRSYLTTGNDTQIVSALDNISPNVYQAMGGNSPGYLYPIRGQSYIYAGLQLNDKQLQPDPDPGGLSGPGSGHTPSVPNVPTGQAWATANSGTPITVGSVSGPDSWRVVAMPETFNNQEVTLVVAYDLGPVNVEIRRLILIELIVGAAIVVVLAAVGVGVVQANLRPLNDIELTAGQIARGHLEHRIPELDPRTEIGSLGHSLNAMLSQVERAFNAQQESEQAAHESEERMRRFIADASHELRTPLTTIRGFAEYYRQRGGVSRTPFTGSTSGGAGGVVPPGKQDSDLPSGSLSGDDIDGLMRRLESEASRMGLLVEDLLQLARLDQQRPLDLGPVDLLVLAADAVQDARIVAPDRDTDLIIGRGAFIIEGDEPRLRQVLANLVNNAIAHTPKGTSIRVRIGSDALPSGQPAVLLDVEDDGPGMTEDQAQRVFERFYRADAARNRASGGTGLGLAIVAGLVQAHGGTVTVRTAPGEGADFQVRLPLSPDALGGEGDEDEEDPGDLDGLSG